MYVIVIQASGASQNFSAQKHVTFPQKRNISATLRPICQRWHFRNFKAYIATFPHTTTLVVYAPLITLARPRLALQRSADHLPRALRLCLPVRSFRHTHRLWRHQVTRAHRARLGTAWCRSNAPKIAPVSLSLAEKPSSDPRPVPLVALIITSIYHSFTTFTLHQPPQCTGKRSSSCWGVVGDVGCASSRRGGGGAAVVTA